MADSLLFNDCKKEVYSNGMAVEPAKVQNSGYGCEDGVGQMWWRESPQGRKYLNAGKIMKGGNGKRGADKTDPKTPLIKRFKK